MKRILLVDDDFLALNAFFTLTDWKKHGLIIDHEAHNAQDALNYLAFKRPDIAFIDVCMPDMDGISLLKKINAMDPSILCVMLSSYSDYPYVREAMKHGARDYLLKHEISKEAVLELLYQCGIDTSDTVEDESEDTSLLNILTKGLSQEYPSISGILVYGYITDSRKLIEAQINSIHKTCKHILNTVGDVAICSPSCRELIMLFPHTSASPDRVEEYVYMASQGINKYHNISYTFLSPRFCSDSLLLTRTYEMYHSEYIQNTQSSKIPLTSNECMALMLAVVNNNKDLVTTLIHTLYENSFAENDLSGFTSKILSIFSHLKQIMGSDEEYPKPLPGSPADLERCFICLFCDLADYNASEKYTTYSHCVDEALNYLHQNFDKDISLVDVAHHCAISYNHLSFLFKKETGKNIIKYLNSIRVYQAARFLLFDTVPLSKLGERVGFNCYNHFFSTFRSLTGMTPSEFRKNPEAVAWMVNVNRKMLRRI